MVGPPNLLFLLEDELDIFDLDEEIKSFRKWYRIPVTKNLYVISFNTTKRNRRLANKVKNEIEIADSKAIVKYSVYVCKNVDGIGEYLFVHHDGKDECTDVLMQVHNIMVENDYDDTI